MVLPLEAVKSFRRHLKIQSVMQPSAYFESRKMVTLNLGFEWNLLACLRAVSRARMTACSSAPGNPHRQHPGPRTF